MKIYTKGGDKGDTSLIGGTRVKKDNIRIEAYGTVDELNSWIGILRLDSKEEQIRETLEKVQNHLFNIGALLAEDPEKSKMTLKQISPAQIEMMELLIDRLDALLPPLKQFILPGGSMRSSHAHISRTVCRRTERLVVSLAQTTIVDDLIIQYLNRLSDMLFVLSRYWEQEDGITSLPWDPEA